MSSFIGESSCKVDVKGRVLFPSTFKKQMDTASQEKFVIKKDIFENCLVLYPMDEWERQNSIIRKKINTYNKQHSRFLREFFKGAAELIPDGNNRMLIPKRLLDQVGIENELIMAGQGGRIEVWAKETYEAGGMSENDFASLAEKILGETEEET